MNPSKVGELQDAHRPIASLLSKTDKALQKLARGSGQHTMLQNRLKALRTTETLTKAELAKREPTQAMRWTAATRLIVVRTLLVCPYQLRLRRTPV